MTKKPIKKFEIRAFDVWNNDAFLERIFEMSAVLNEVIEVVNSLTQTEKEHK